MRLYGRGIAEAVHIAESGCGYKLLSRKRHGLVEEDPEENNEAVMHCHDSAEPRGIPFLCRARPQASGSHMRHVY
jgi:hypothetical protein